MATSDLAEMLTRAYEPAVPAGALGGEVPEGELPDLPLVVVAFDYGAGWKVFEYETQEQVFLHLLNPTKYGDHGSRRFCARVQEIRFEES